MNKNKILLVLLYFSICQYGVSQNTINLENCNIETIEGCFFYEKSSSIVFVDDMILRDPAIVWSNNCAVPDYSHGLFITGESIWIVEEMLNCKNSKALIEEISNTQESVNKQINNIKNNYGHHDKKIGEYIYTKINLDIKYLYIGEMSFNFIDNQNIVVKKVPVYILTEIIIN